MSLMTNMSVSLCMCMVIAALLCAGPFLGGGFTESQSILNQRRTISPDSTAVFRVGGNVHPSGYFYATLKIGDPPRLYDLDIDTGSDLTWVHCDAPCVNCPKSPHKPYKPRGNALTCKDTLCTHLQQPSNYPCDNPTDQCDYQIEYYDHGESLGVAVRDIFPVEFLNGSVVRPSLAFGCGYDQRVSASVKPPFVDGVLGLANGKSSILSQLHDLKMVRNVFGHCFSSEGGGYLFIGGQLIPSQTLWVPMSKNRIGSINFRDYHSIGPAELLLGGQSVVNAGLSFVLDTGSTYTYLKGDIYKALASKMKNTIDNKQLKLAPEAEDGSLPICWKGTKPFTSINDVKKFFKPLALRFSKAKNAMMELPPEAYLIISEKGNACFGILNGSEAELGDLNILGDISMLNKIVTYDNEENKIGWATANCNRLPKL